MAAKTWIIVIEQTVLEPWKGQVDLTDAALINHVVMRLTRREHQKIVLHEGTACVWVHYPTVRAENWMIDITDKSLGVRFAKLVDLGLLVRTQLSVKNNGSCRGSRSYFGIGPALKARFEAVDSAEPVDNLTTDTPLEGSHSYEAPLEGCDYDTPLDAAQSPGLSQGKRVAAGAGLRSVRPGRPPSAPSPKKKPGGEEKSSEEERGELLELRKEQARRMIAQIPDQVERLRAKAQYLELGYCV